MAIGTGVGTAETPSVTADTPVRGRRARRLRIPWSPKVLIGLGMLVFFVLLGVIGPLVAPYDPTASLPSRTCCPSSWWAAAARCWWPSWRAWSRPRCRSSSG